MNQPHIIQNYQAYTVEQRPDLADQAAPFNAFGWPVFMCQDPNEQQYWPLLDTLFPQHQIMLCQGEEVVAVGNAIPLYWNGDVEGLPEGWGAALAQGMNGFRQQQVANCVSALAIVVHPEHRRKGLSRFTLEAMLAFVKAQGIDHLIAPVRPSLKQHYPHATMEEYVSWRRPDGTPFDPWVRVHWSLGAKILSLAPESMKITGSVAQWAKWTGMDFPHSGEYIVKGALQPVKVDVPNDVGIYKEPNVWMHHDLEFSDDRLVRSRRSGESPY